MIMAIKCCLLRQVHDNIMGHKDKQVGVIEELELLDDVTTLV